MARKQIGVTSPVPMGEWTSAQKYYELNIVTHNSSTYMAKLPSTRIEPGVTAGWGDYWMVLFSVQTDDIATKAYVNSKVADYLPLAGGTMTGWIDMGNHIITNLSDPTNTQDAANKKYVDTSSSSSATIDGTGLISYKNSAGTTLFTLQLPIYNGGVS